MKEKKRISTKVKDVVEDVDKDHAVDISGILQLEQNHLAVGLSQHIAEQVVLTKRRNKANCCNELRK